MRFSLIAKTLSVRVSALVRATMQSPARTLEEGLAILPFRRTAEPRQASAASLRVLYTRTLQSQRSSLREVGSGFGELGTVWYS